MLLNGFNMAQAQFMDAMVTAAPVLKDGVRFDAIGATRPSFAPRPRTPTAQRGLKTSTAWALHRWSRAVLFTFSCSGGISADLFTRSWHPPGPMRRMATPPNAGAHLTTR